MVTVYITCGTMASGDDMSSRPKDDHSGVNFRNELRRSWNAPKSFVDLYSMGVVALDTSVVPDVLGLKAFYDEAELVRVLPGMAENIIRILIPDDCAEPRGFHDNLLEDICPRGFSRGNERPKATLASVPVVRDVGN